MREFETRLRGYLERATVDQREHLQRQLTERIEKVKQAAVKEVRRQTQAYRDTYRIDREQAMRAQYDNLMGLRTESVHRKRSSNAPAESSKVSSKPPIVYSTK